MGTFRKWTEEELSLLQNVPENFMSVEGRLYMSPQLRAIGRLLLYRMSVEQLLETPKEAGHSILEALIEGWAAAALFSIEDNSSAVLWEDVGYTRFPSRMFKEAQGEVERLAWGEFLTYKREETLDTLARGYPPALLGSNGLTRAAGVELGFWRMSERALAGGIGEAVEAILAGVPVEHVFPEFYK